MPLILRRSSEMRVITELNLEAALGHMLIGDYYVDGIMAGGAATALKINPVDVFII
jgi:hypothetical protein